MTTTASALPTETWREMYRVADLIKQCDERFRLLIQSGEIVVTYYSPRGQEIIPAAMSTQLRPDDYVLTIYRGLHDHIAKGVPLPQLWAEFLGKRAGTCKGKGGPMHITHPASGLMVTTGVVGSGLPIATGFGLASVLDGNDRVTVVNFGDGASNIGAFHEALNLAAVWNLPVIFLCQNNQYAEHTRMRDGTSIDNIADRAAAYSMAGETVDGNDPEEMVRAAATAVERARSGGGPTLLEAVTYRFHGHLMGDDMSYMPVEEREAAMEADPLPRFRALMIERGHAADAELSAIEAENSARIDEAVEFALAAEPPDPSELDDDVYTEVIP